MKLYKSLLIIILWSSFFFSFPIQAQAAAFEMQTGYYVGDGTDGKSIVGVGFQPDLVLIKDDTGNGSLGVIWKSSAMSGEVSSLTADAAVDISSGAIKSLDSDGFTLGTNVDVNAANIRYTYVAFSGSDCSATGTFCVGSYLGDGSSSRAIADVGFQPNMVAIKGDAAVSGVYRTSSEAANRALQFGSNNENTDGSQFKTLDATGFTIGNSTRVNTNGTTYWYFAFKSTAGIFAEGTFTGDGVDGKAITGLGFKPNYLWLKNANATTGISARFNVTESNGDYSGTFNDNSSVTGNIKSLDSDGFTVGSNVAINENTKDIYWVAFAGAQNPSPSGTYRMKVGTYTGNGTTQAITGAGFAPDLVLIKDTNGVNYAVFRTKLMKGDTTAFVSNAAANFSGGITSLDADGFTLGSDVTVNTASTSYSYQAFGNAYNPENNVGAADFYIGALTGSGADNREIFRNPFQPDLIVIKSTTSTNGMWRTSSQTGDAALGFSGLGESTDIIQGIHATGFQVGTSSRANGGGNLVHFFTFKSSNTLSVNQYTGTGASQNISAPGFSPDLVWVKSTGTAQAVLRPSSLVGDASQLFVATAVTSDRITGLLADGFSLGGSQSETNVSGHTYHYATWKINESASVPTLNLPADAATEVSTTPTLSTTANDGDSDYVRYKIEICTNEAMSLGCQTVVQSSSQTGWSGQNTQSNTAYTSGTEASYTLQTPLSTGTTYYWRTYAVDPDGSAVYSETQSSVFSFTTVSVPTAPSALSGVAASTTSITWSFTDTANNENDFHVLDGSDTVKCSVGSGSSGTGGTVACTETGLTANTAYTRKVVASNGLGDSDPTGNATASTYSVVPTSSNVTSSQSTMTLTSDPSFVFTNTLGFGSGSVEYFKYVWNTDATHVFTGSENVWSSTTLTTTADLDSNSWYLHLQGFNSDDVPNGTADLGPYYFEGTESTALPSARFIAPSLISPAHDAYVRRSIVSYTFSHQDARISNVSHYRISINNGEQILDQIPAFGSANYKTDEYLVEYRNIGDGNEDNDFLIVTPTAAALQEGKNTWQVTAFDNTGSTRSVSRLVYLDKVGPSVENIRLGTAILNGSFRTSSQSPQLTGKIVDALHGRDSSNRIAAGPVNMQITIEKKGLLGVYSVVSTNDLNLTEKYFEHSDQKIVDNNEQLARKYANFSFTPAIPLSFGEYRFTWAGFDEAGNQGGQVVFTVSVVNDFKSGQKLTYINSGEAAIRQLAPLDSQSSSASAGLNMDAKNETLSEPVAKENPVFGFVNGTASALRSISTLVWSGVNAAGNLVSQIVGRQQLTPWLAHTTDEVAHKMAMTLDVWLNREPTRISNVKIQNLEANQAVVTWTTNQYTSNNKVNYGETLSFGSEVYSEDRQKNHRVVLEQLKPSTTYVFEVMSQGRNYTYDAHYEFTTRSQ